MLPSTRCCGGVRMLPECLWILVRFLKRDGRATCEEGQGGAQNPKGATARHSRSSNTLRPAALTYNGSSQCARLLRKHFVRQHAASCGVKIISGRMSLLYRRFVGELQTQSNRSHS